jgi:hypothetical protein
MQDFVYYWLNTMKTMFYIYIYIYCDGLAQSIARQRPSKHVPTHESRKNTVKVFSLRQRTESCYATRLRWRHTSLGTPTDTWQLCNNIGSVFSVRGPCRRIISGTEYRLWWVQLAVGDSHGKFIVAVRLWRLSVWLEYLVTVRVL